MFHLRLLLAVLLLNMVSSDAFSQKAYDHAMNMRSYVQYKGKETRNKDKRVADFRFNSGQGFSYSALMLSYYVPQDYPKPLRTNGDVIEAYRDNPFIAPFLPPLPDSTPLEDMTGAGYAPLKTFNVSNAADGLARFLIKRGKEELGVAFFSRMKIVLNKNPECATLFPTTTAFLNSIEAYRYAELMQSLRDAFDKDLDNLVINLNQVMNLPKYKLLMETIPEIRLAIRSSVIVSQLTQSGTNVYPTTIIHELAAMNESYGMDPNLGNAFKMADVISSNLQFEYNKRLWITINEVNKMVQDEVSLRLFLGLIYEQVKNISFTCNGTTISVQKYMKDNVNNPYALANIFENFIWLANDIDADVATFKKKEDVTAEEYNAYLAKAVNITEYGFKVAGMILPCISETPYIVMSQNAIGLYKNIRTKNYSSAIMNTYRILDMSLNKSTALAKEKAARLKAEGRAISDSLQKLCNTPPSLKTKHAVETVLKYGNFMASVLKAQSPEEVSEAIEAAALPVGSYSIKQKSKLNLSANAYVGYCWDFNHSGLYMRGVYAPVGFTLSTAISKKFGGAVGLFGSLIDVGGIVAYRLENGSTDNLKQEIRLESIFSPSVQLMIGIPKLPLAICAGWRMTPKLFYKDNTGFTAVLPQHVFNMGILVDIPLFNIINKPFE